MREIQEVSDFQLRFPTGMQSAGPEGNQACILKMRAEGWLSVPTKGGSAGAASAVCIWFPARVC